MEPTNKNKNWGLGDILGRSKDGFLPVNTEERDGLVGDDSDSEVEEFSVPALHAWKENSLAMARLTWNINKSSSPPPQARVIAAKISPNLLQLQMSISYDAYMVNNNIT